MKAEDKGLRDVPCPECGRAASPHIPRRTPGYVLGAAIAGLTITLFGFAPDLGPLDLLAGAVAGGGAVFSALVGSYWFVATRNPPGEKRRRKALDLVERDKIHSVRPGAASPKPHSKRLSLLVIPWCGAIAMLAAGIGIPLAHDGYNADVRPRFVTPGDEVEYEFDERIRAVRGFWRGSPAIHATTVPDRRPIRVEGIGRDDVWAEEISVNRKHEAQEFNPSVRFPLPSEPDLVGKSLDISISMRLEYPEAIGITGQVERFQDSSKSMKARISVKISSKSDVLALKAAWWTGSGLAIIAALLILLRLLGARQIDRPLDLELGTPPSQP